MLHLDTSVLLSPQLHRLSALLIGNTSTKRESSRRQSLYTESRSSASVAGGAG